jgi:hypothetical protein
MFDPIAKRSAERAWEGNSDLRYSQRLLIMGVCALTGWGLVILIGLGVLRLLGY